MSKVSLQWIGTSGFKARLENERFTLIYLKFDYFTSLCSLPQWAIMREGRAERYYSSFNLWFTVLWRVCISTISLRRKERHVSKCPILKFSKLPIGLLPCSAIAVFPQKFYCSSNGQSFEIGLVIWFFPTWTDFCDSNVTVFSLVNFDDSSKRPVSQLILFSDFALLSTTVFCSWDLGSILWANDAKSVWLVLELSSISSLDCTWSRRQILGQIGHQCDQ